MMMLRRNTSTKIRGDESSYSDHGTGKKDKKKCKCKGVDDGL